MSTFTYVIPVRKATEADSSGIDQILARAFCDDPIVAWVIPNAAKRDAILVDMFEAFRAAIGRHDEILTTRDREGVALWVPPGEVVVDPDTADAFGEQLAPLLGTDMDRFAMLSDVLDANHPHEPSFYLNFVAVAPNLQGRGIGSALMLPVLARCDRAGVGAYLVATTERNARLYQRHGFEVMQEVALPDGPSMWPMWREPARG